MLRQKLLLFLAMMVALLLASGVAAVTLLQSVLRDFEHVGDEIIAGATSITGLQAALGDLEHALQSAPANDQTIDRSRLVSMAGAIQADIDGLQRLEVIQTEAAAEYAALRQSAIAITNTVVAQPIDPAIMVAIADAREHLAVVRETMQARAEGAKKDLTARFRWIVVGLGLAFVLLINGSVALLARMSTMILKPIDRLVEASRHLAREEFDHRIPIDRRDEFGELARAYNSVAAQLQANEERRMEVLQQVALTLSHELNNAMAIIQLQLDRVSRAAGAGGDGATAQSHPLQDIQDALTRMTATVAALGRVRRIVLTDYTGGVKMLDLQASVAE